MSSGQPTSKKTMFLSRFGKATASCSFITLITDLMEPLGPMAVLALVAALFTFLVSIMTRKLFKTWEEEISVVGLAAILVAIVSGFLVVYQGSNPAAAKDGVLASKFPAAEELQSIIFGMSKNLIRIEENTAATAANTREMTDTLKRETSDDPRKELANMGVSWSYESLMEALSNRDARTVELFIEGGMRPKPDVFRWLAGKPHRGHSTFSPEIGRLLVAKKVFDPVQACDMDAEFLSEALSHAKRGVFVREVCGTDAVIERANSERKSASDKLSQAVEFNSVRDDKISRCIVELKDRYTVDSMFAKAAKFNIMTRSTISSPEEIALAGLKQKLLFDGFGDPGQAYHEAIALGCEDANRARPENHEAVEMWKAIITALSTRAE